MLKLSELLREWGVRCVPVEREVKMNEENMTCLNKMSVGAHS